MHKKCTAFSLSLSTCISLCSKIWYSTSNLKNKFFLKVVSIVQFKYVYINMQFYKYGSPKCILCTSYFLQTLHVIIMANICFISLREYFNAEKKIIKNFLRCIIYFLKCFRNTLFSRHSLFTYIKRVISFFFYCLQQKNIKYKKVTQLYFFFEIKSTTKCIF